MRGKQKQIINKITSEMFKLNPFFKGSDFDDEHSYFQVFRRIVFKLRYDFF